MHYHIEVNSNEFFKSKAILIIGACGTIGRNLAREILKCQPARLRLLDVDDTGLTELNDELTPEDDNGALRFLYGSIRDKERLIRASEDIDYIFHCAAIKHVAIGEYNPREVVQTNIIGTQNVIDAALATNVRKVIFTSSDKAVNPTNTMGASKLVGEKLIVAANNMKGIRNISFSAVRFGNVLGSRGSIIPRFKRRIENGLDLIVTNPQMTRFMMPIQKAVDLLIKSMIQSKGGEIFVLKMPTMLLNDLVMLFSDYVQMIKGIKPRIKVIGTFPGEKNYEELMSEDEIARALETKDMYIILPHIKELLDKYDEGNKKQLGKIHTKEYNSQHTTAISKEEMKEMFDNLKIFENA